MNKPMNIENIESQDKVLLLKVLEAVKSISYGSIQITIHNSRVVQIEKTEKIKVKETKGCVCS